MKVTFLLTESSELILSFRKRLYKEFVAPLDGMWQDLHIASSTTYLIYVDNQEVGFASVDHEGALLQIFLIDEVKYKMPDCINALIDDEVITSAKLSSIEPVSFNACLDRSLSVKKNTINYHYSIHQKKLINPKLNTKHRKAMIRDLDSVKLFLNVEIGFDDQYGYSENIINRKEAFLFEENGEIVAIGECRLSDTQNSFADLGMMVKNNQRGKGLGTYVFSKMIDEANCKERIPICSTTADNIASQIAIKKAGFYATHIIFDMSF
tara:strand:+ start:1999 stop:2796 length:798 start_codon:yes stop_codon:yes gene_type:complete